MVAYPVAVLDKAANQRSYGNQQSIYINWETKKQNFQWISCQALELTSSDETL
jgi:hypothetical protein